MKTLAATNLKIRQARRCGHMTAQALIWFILIAFQLAVPVTARAAKPGLSVTVRGINGALKANAMAFLQIAQLAKSDQPLPGPARIRYLHQQAGHEIKQALQPFGYYQPTIDSSLKQTPAGGWQAVYTIAHGPALPIGKIDIRVVGPGKDDPTFRKIITNTPIKKGQTLNQQAYDKLKSALQSAATERGYFDAHMLVNRIVIDLQNYQATVIVHYDTGERYRLGKVTFTKSPLWPKLLQRYVTFHPGDPYDAAELLKLQSDLLSSDYFDQVTIDAPPNKAVKHVIPVTVELSMRKRSKYTFGLGYATDTGIHGRADFKRRWVNKRGHSFDVQLAASQIKGTLGFAYSIPGKKPQTDAYKIRFTVARENSSNKDYLNADLGFTKQYFSHGWTKLYNLDYLWERFNPGTGNRNTTLLIPDVNWSRVDADNRLDVSDGSSLTLDAKAAAKPLLSSLSFVQLSVHYKWIHSFNSRNRLILRTAAGGTLLNNADFDQFPTSLRFFAGGDNSVRGYALDSIGPVDSQGNVVGGKRLLVGSIEYDYRIFGRWSVAAFVDSGDAFDTSPSFKTGAGVGLRWRSPVGPIRIDLAHGFEKPGDPFRIHFSIGPEL